mmetsp:Transcript_8220/g.30356  ORF Transcript_8220/g.30356 Transcript_8220/m.30356 type:complete len:99 (+) Transcript_8220:1801-2097(+)
MRMSVFCIFWSCRQGFRKKQLNSKNCSTDIDSFTRSLHIAKKLVAFESQILFWQPLHTESIQIVHTRSEETCLSEERNRLTWFHIKFASSASHPNVVR